MCERDEVTQQKFLVNTIKKKATRCRYENSWRHVSFSLPQRQATRTPFIDFNEQSDYLLPLWCNAFRISTSWEEVWALNLLLFLFPFIGSLRTCYSSPDIWWHFLRSTFEYILPRDFISHGDNPTFAVKNEPPYEMTHYLTMLLTRAQNTTWNSRRNSRALEKF